MYIMLSTVEDGQKVVDLFYSGEYYNLVLMGMEIPIKDGPHVNFFCFNLFFWIYSSNIIFKKITLENEFINSHH